VVVFVIKIDELDLFAVDPKRHPLILGDDQAPDSLAVASQHMCLPARHGAQLLFRLHVLEERDDALHLGDDNGLQSAGIVVLDDPSLPLMDHVSDLHSAR
jgi:hypothetical protein